MWTQPGTIEVSLKWIAVNLFFKEEPMDYLKFEELQKIWDTANAQHHVT